MQRTYEYPPALRPDQPPLDQLQEKKYGGKDLKPTVDHTKKVRKRHGLGPDAAHALLAADSRKEQKAVGRVLKRLRPLRLHDIETSNSGRPKRPVLFGVISIGVPVVVPLQSAYHHNQRKSSDLFVIGLYPLPGKGLWPIKQKIFEFDFFPTHQTQEGLERDRKRNKRSAWGDEDWPSRLKGPEDE